MANIIIASEFGTRMKSTEALKFASNLPRNRWTTRAIRMGGDLGGQI